MGTHKRPTHRARTRAPLFIHVSAILALMVFLLTSVLLQAADPPPFGAVRVTPISQTFTAGGTANFDVSVVDSWGHEIPNVSVKLTITGAKAGTTTAITTNNVDYATLSDVGNSVGSDTVVANGTLNSHTVDSRSVTVTWNASTTDTVTLSPTGASAPINTSTTFTATLKDGNRRVHDGHLAQRHDHRSRRSAPR